MTLETIPSFVEGILAGGGGKSGSLVQNLFCESGSWSFARSFSYCCLLISRVSGVRAKGFSWSVRRESFSTSIFLCGWCCYGVWICCCWFSQLSLYVHATGCFAELYFSPVVGLGPMVDLNLAYLLKGERINMSSTQVWLYMAGVFFFYCFCPCNSKISAWTSILVVCGRGVFWFFCMWVGLSGWLILKYFNTFLLCFCFVFYNSLFLWDSRQFFRRIQVFCLTHDHDREYFGQNLRNIFPCHCSQPSVGLSLPDSYLLDLLLLLCRITVTILQLLWSCVDISLRAPAFSSFPSQLQLLA